MNTIITINTKLRVYDKKYNLSKKITAFRHLNMYYYKFSNSLNILKKCI